jgi:hypothetical protein
MKTSTQSLVKTLKNNNISAHHIHTIPHLEPLYAKDLLKKPWEQQKLSFLDYLKEYKTANKKKLKIITVIRNPIDRIKSAFFQIYHNGEMNNNNILKENTTVSKNSVNQLINMFLAKIETDSLLGVKESLDELSTIFDTDIISNLQNKTTHYYYENQLVKLYVLDFNTVVSKNALDYLNTILNLKLTTYVEANKSDSKTYYNKYKIFKERCAAEEKSKYIENIIQRQYSSFYFEAFK